MSTHNQPPEDNHPVIEDVTFVTIIKSVFCSFFGIQSNANRRRDFESGKFWHFFAAGIIFVFCFIVVIILGVNYLIATT